MPGAGAFLDLKLLLYGVDLVLVTQVILPEKVHVLLGRSFLVDCALRGCKPELLLLGDGVVLVGEVVVHLSEVAVFLEQPLIRTKKLLGVSHTPVRPLSIALGFHLVKVTIGLSFL